MGEGKLELYPSKNDGARACQVHFKIKASKNTSNIMYDVFSTANVLLTSSYHLNSNST